MPKTPHDPLYYHARRAVLHANDTGISHLQRRLRIGYQHAIDLRHALRGDVLEHQADTDTWHIRAEADRHTDFLLEEKLAQAARLIGSAKALVIAAGAGMGIDSGLPDFRGDEGFLRAYPALGRQGLCFQTIASPPAFEQVPLTAWGFYGHRLNLYRATAPHAGFGVLHAWGQRMAQGCFVFTSNVDGHFQKAGFPRPAFMNATAPSTACNARPIAAARSGPRPTCTRRWTKPLASGRANCPTAHAAARWRGPMC